MVRRVTRDLHREPVLRFLDKYHGAINFLFAMALFLGGWLIGGLFFGASMLLWGFFVRIVFGWHMTLLVNSVAHRWGYRNYASKDNSRNCWWLALLTFDNLWRRLA